MRRWLTVTALVAACVFLLDTLLWMLGSHVLTTRTVRWIAQAQAHGWTVSAGERSAGGWPFAATLAIERAGIAGGERIMPGGLSWSADRVVVSISLAHPATLRIAADGQQFLRLSHLQDIGFTAAQAVVRLPLTGHQAGRLYAAFINGGIAGSRHPQDVQIADLALLIQQDTPAHPQPGALPGVMRLSLQASGIGLPDIGRWPLGATIASLDTALTLSSPSLPDQPADGQLRAGAWRDGGGKLTIDEARLRWGPLAVTAHAVLGLDSRLQPSGAGSADIAGSAPALDAASHAGLIPPGLALTAQAILAVMSHVAGPDGKDAVRLPFQLHDSTVSVGEIPIVRIPAVAWRSGPLPPPMAGPHPG